MHLLQPFLSNKVIPIPLKCVPARTHTHTHAKDFTPFIICKGISNILVLNIKFPWEVIECNDSQVGRLQIHSRNLWSNQLPLYWLCEPSLGSLEQKNCPVTMTQYLDTEDQGCYWCTELEIHYFVVRSTQRMIIGYGNNASCYLVC